MSTSGPEVQNVEPPVSATSMSNSGCGTFPKQHKDVYSAISPDALPGSMRGRTVLVTGAGRGIGRAIALSFANAGAKGLAILSRTEGDLQSLASEITRKYPETKVLVCVADVSDRAALEKVIKDIERELGSIDVMVSNAAALSIRPFAHTPGEEWWRTIETNLRGPMTLAELVLPNMRAKNEGAIVFIASRGGIVTLAGCSGYGVSKTALIRACSTLQLELDTEAGGPGKSGIHMYALHPGFVKTDMMLPALHPDIEKMQKGFSEHTREFFEKYYDQTPELCAQTCVYLATGRASALRGRYIDVGNDIEDLVRQADIVNKENLYNLGVKMLGGEFFYEKEWNEAEEQ